MITAPSIAASLPWQHCTMLRDALHAMGGDEPGAIPPIVRLLENPASPIALPGSIDLYGHDCLHVLLERGFSAEDEAFVVGFSMGTDEACRWWHVVVFKLVAFWLYPRVYRLNAAQLTVFDQGFAYGRSLERRNLHRLDWRSLVDESIAALREQLGLHRSIGGSNNPPGLATP